MKIACTLVNAAWLASCWPSARRFQKALKNTRAVQEGMLRRLIETNKQTAFGREHRFDSIKTYGEFAERIPIRSYEEITPWIERIRRGESSVLTSDPVTHLIPTSGSTSARKLIPFTRSLQKEFDAAIAPWMVDLFRQAPTMVGGPAYWSITPQTLAEDIDSVVPVGFASDAEYLGGLRGRMVEAIMVRPSEAALNGGLSEFRVATLAALVRARDLRLISVWHPSFLTLLLEELPRVWPLLLKVKGRAKLPEQVPQDLRELWPNLKWISCWGDGHAESGVREIERRFPAVKVQAKGLLATEGCVSLPLGGEHPLAITSHFLEFLDDAGKVRRADELEAESVYEVILTTGGGLWRYRLGDRIRVRGFVSQTASIQFIGRSGQISDLRGEKLTEEFVADCLRKLAAEARFAMVAPSLEGDRAHYMLIIEGDVERSCGEKLDELLGANIHYREARELGQLGPVETLRVGRNAFATYAEHLVRRGQKLGDIKPVALAKELEWGKVFAPCGNHLRTPQRAC